MRITPMVSAGLAVVSALSGIARADESVNQWLVAGPFPMNGPVPEVPAWIEDAGAGRDGAPEWTAFDDRLFCRNLDDYQDLRDFFRIRNGIPEYPCYAVARVWIHVPAVLESTVLLGADTGLRVWMNSEMAAEVLDGPRRRDEIQADVRLDTGWNELTVQVWNAGELTGGRLGFWARLVVPEDAPRPVFALAPPGGELSLDTGVLFPSLPTAYREFPYWDVDARRDPSPEIAGFVQTRSDISLRAGPVRLAAGGGEAPYTWAVTAGRLPPGLVLREDGCLSGTVAPEAELGTYRVSVSVRDQAGDLRTADLEIPVEERPSLWYERAGLVALIHNPESMQGATDAEFLEFGQMMKRQGYGLGMVISYNNGGHRYRWPSRFDPENPLTDLLARYKQALEAAGVRFGMYFGNFNGPNHAGDDGALLVMEEALERFAPEAVWFDWASVGVDGHGSIDALYSVIRSHDPGVLIVLNGAVTMYTGDWDVICFEGWGCWGDDRRWGSWPFDLAWPKKPVIESWRLLPEPGFEYTEGLSPNWQQMLKVQISLIGEGYVANIDHSATIATPFERPAESVVWQAHRAMADWAARPETEPLSHTFTNIVPAPLPEPGWGYVLMSPDRDRFYLHALVTPRGKTGLPADGVLEVGALDLPVRRVVWANRGTDLAFRTTDTGALQISVSEVEPDPVDTVFTVELEAPVPVDWSRSDAGASGPVPPGNLAYGRPARLTSVDGTRDLVPSAFAFARYGVDGREATHAQGAYEWAWAYEVDLEQQAKLDRVVVRFARGGYATEFALERSLNGRDWESMIQVDDGDGGTWECGLDGLEARFVRVRAIKPDGPNQTGGQMGIAELEVYGVEP